MLKKLLKIMFFMMISSIAYGQIHYLQANGIGASTFYNLYDQKYPYKVEYNSGLYNNDILISADGKITKISLITVYTKGCGFENKDILCNNHEQSSTTQDTQIQFDIIRDGIEMPLSNGKFIFSVGTKELDNQEHIINDPSNTVKKGDILKIHAKEAHKDGCHDYYNYYDYFSSFINLNAIIQLETDD